MLAFVYYLGASWPLVIVASRFFVVPSLIAGAILSLAAGLLSVPWLLRSPTAALALSALPPIGLIGWASPLVSAGVLFPGLGFAGLLLTASIPSLLALNSPRRLSAVLSLAGLSAVTNLTAPSMRSPADWVAFNISAAAAEGFASSHAVWSAVARFPSGTFVFPEGTIELWNAATDAYWDDFSLRLKSKKKTVLLGTTITGDRGRSLNVVKAVGEGEPTVFPQRVPVPLAMWNLASRTSGFDARIFGEPTFRLNRTVVAPLICYEQLLVWTQLTAAMASPEILLALSSQRWTSGTPIAAIQTASMQSWSRLFSTPVVQSIRR